MGKHINKAYPLRLKDKQRTKLEKYVAIYGCTKLEIISQLIDDNISDEVLEMASSES